MMIKTVADLQTAPPDRLTGFTLMSRQRARDGAKPETESTMTKSTTVIVKIQVMNVCLQALF